MHVLFGNISEMDVNSFERYFIKTLELLEKYQWLYDLQLTHFFIEAAWKKIPEDWIDPFINKMTYEELRDVPFGYTKESFPEALRIFLQSSLQLSLRHHLPKELSTFQLKKELTLGMNPKKLHEVSHMTSFVHNLCQEHDWNQIVDIGSGLGYLSLVLSSQLGYKVLGVECEESRCQGADLRASKLTSDHHTSGIKLDNFVSVPIRLRGDHQTRQGFREVMQSHFCRNVHHDDRTTESSSSTCMQTKCDKHCGIPAKINPPSTSVSVGTAYRGTEYLDNTTHCHEHQLDSDTVTSATSNTFQRSDSAQELLKGGELDTVHISQSFDSESLRVLLLGLHCCGDLTPTMLQLFVQMEELKGLVVVGCCYHRMTENVDGGFNCFPMSDVLKHEFSEAQTGSPAWCINKFGLRLAAQETRTRWQQQSEGDHMYHSQNVAFRGIFEQALKEGECELQKEKRKLTPNRNQMNDFKGFVEHALSRATVKGSLSKQQLVERMTEVYDRHLDAFKFIEPFTCLQVVLQGVLESLILADRLAFLHQHNIKAKLVPIMDDGISPRNIAIVAWKS